MSLREKLQKFENIEEGLCKSLKCASRLFRQLSKDEPDMPFVNSMAYQFLDSLQKIDSEIGNEIAYLRQASTTAQSPHEGSSYDSKKALDMAQHRLEHVRSKLSELDRSKIAENINNHEKY